MGNVRPKYNHEPSLEQASQRLNLPRAPEDLSLETSQGLFATLVRHGARCPCCGRYGQIYPWRIDSGAAYSLAWLVMHSEPGQFIHLPTKANRRVLTSNKMGILRFWGLTERTDNTDTPEKKHKGEWRATEEGRQWVMVPNRTVQCYCYTFDDHLLAMGGPHVTIRDALGTKFDYKAMMEGAW